MAVSFDTGIFSVIGINSELLVGAQLFWYASGTSTPLATYSDSGLTVPNTNPVVASSTGRFGPIYLQAAEYKYILKTALGVTLVTRDPIDGETALDILAGADGAGFVGFSHDETYDQGTVGIHDKARICITDAPFNAVGNRTTDNAAAIHAALTYAAGFDQYPAAIDVPAGHFHTASTLELAQQCSIEGHGPGSVFNNQTTPLAAPVFTNGVAYGLINAQFRNVSIYGGTHALKLQATNENAELQFTNVAMLLQTTAAIEVNQLFQSCKIWNCTIGSSPYGLKLDGSGCNSVYSLGTVWNSLTECSIYSRGAQCLTVIGGRFEGAGVTGKNTLDIENADTVTFIGVYFENTGEFLLRCRSIRGAIVFQSCHFSGTLAGTAPIQGNGLRPYQWDCADQQVTFRDCYSDTQMFGPANMRIEGNCPNIYPSKALYWGNDYRGGIYLTQPITTASYTALKWIRPTAGSIQNVQAMNCSISLAYAGIGPSPTGLSRTLGRKYDALVSALQVFNVAGELAQIGSDQGNLNTATVALSYVNASPTEIDLQVDWAGTFDPATEQSSAFTIAVEWSRAQGLPPDDFVVTAP